MRVLGAVALLTTAAEAATDLPIWAYLLGIGLPAVFGARWWLRSESKRLVDAQGTSELASAELTEQQSEKIKEELRLSVLESVRDDMARQREETARAQASEKEALAEVAILIAQHARDRAEWKDERHALVNENLVLRQDLDQARREVQELRAEVETLRVALGVERGRRIDDDRLTHLEKRAHVSEKRADRAQHQADVAKEVADEQEHRNDDTPGHA